MKTQLDTSELIELAGLAIRQLKWAIANRDKKAIIKSYELLEENEAFTWEDECLNNLFEEWDKLTDESNDIIYS